MFEQLWIHPALIMLIGALFLPLVGRLGDAWRKGYLLLVPLLSFFSVLQLQEGIFGRVGVLDWVLVFGRVDGLSMVFAFMMTMISLVATLYALEVKNDYEHLAAWSYSAGALGVIFAGDLLVLFVFWELMAFASTFLVWFRGDHAALAAGFRYLMIHALGGVILLAGIIMHYHNSGDLSFNQFDVSAPSLAIYLILIGFMLNAAVPPLHAWLPDAYSKATVSGAIFMCALTSKTAVYALCRGFAGLELLVILGLIMTFYGIIYALLANDIRQLLSYHIISQVGYMVTAIGVGSALALNGAVAHAFANILYKSLLFMGIGAVLYMTGKSKASELGGLYKKMPVVLLLTVMGGLAISGFPLLVGFISKNMIVSSVLYGHGNLAGFLLLLAGVGTFLSVGIKVPYAVWLGQNRCTPETWEKAGEPPVNMTLAMSVLAFFCLLLGLFPSLLYNILPYDAPFNPYTAYTLAETIQLLLFTGLGFYLFIDKMQPKDKLSLDLDWFYRKGTPVLLHSALFVANRANTWASEYIATRLPAGLNRFVADGPARLCLFIAKPFWQLSGVKIDGEDGAEQRMLEQFRRSLFSIGSCAIFTALLLLALLLLG